MHHHLHISMWRCGDGGDGCLRHFDGTNIISLVVHDFVIFSVVHTYMLIVSGGQSGSEEHAPTQEHKSKKGIDSTEKSLKRLEPPKLF